MTNTKPCLAVTDAATLTVMSNKTYKQALYPADTVLKILFNDRFSKELERELKSYVTRTEWMNFVSACKSDFRKWWPHLYDSKPKKTNTTVVVENNTIEQSLETTNFCIEKKDRKFQYNSKKVLSRKNRDKEHRQKKQEKKKQERKEKKRKQKQVEKVRYQKKILASIDKINLSRQWEYDEI
jgi:hypothetical protein